MLQPCEVSEACEPYLKEDRNKERLALAAKQYCERLGAYRMPLAWIAVALNRIVNGAQYLDKSDATSTVNMNAVTGRRIMSATVFFDPKFCSF